MHGHRKHGRHATPLTIGDQFPTYNLRAVVGGNLSTVEARRPDDYFTPVTSDDYAGKWRIVTFWPEDFAAACPDEVAAFGGLYDAFADRGAQVLGVSVDDEFAHLRWRARHEALKFIPFPMLSDPERELTAATGGLNADGFAERATFIVDPDNEIRFVSVGTGFAGRDVDEALRTLDALQSAGNPGNARRHATAPGGLPPVRG
ncbi:peroxiredoxin [Prescottella agglutinans]|uniref:Peroxiredoxin n=1 Tax=Prescottella agglutinans TaxID=1644129 RepID=A0A3S3BUP1_9NOCA|nr:peroxiredoxin [Prescottella agglutinans]